MGWAYQARVNNNQKLCGKSFHLVSKCGQISDAFWAREGGLGVIIERGTDHSTPFPAVWFNLGFFLVVFGCFWLFLVVSVGFVVGFPLNPQVDHFEQPSRHNKSSDFF